MNLETLTIRQRITERIKKDCNYIRTLKPGSRKKMLTNQVNDLYSYLNETAKLETTLKEKEIEIKRLREKLSVAKQLMRSKGIDIRDIDHLKTRDFYI